MGSNEDIKLLAAGKGIRLWQVAEHLGITEFTLSRWLRRELPSEKKDLIMVAIKTLSQERGGNCEPRAI